MCLGAMACLSQVAHADPMDDLDAAQQKVFDAWQNVPFSQRAVLFDRAAMIAEADTAGIAIVGEPASAN